MHSTIGDRTLSPPFHYILLQAKISKFSHTGAIPLDGNRVVDGTGLILLDELRCTGREASLFNCSHNIINGLSTHNCDHADDAGVKCIGMKIIIVVKTMRSKLMLLIWTIQFALKEISG